VRVPGAKRKDFSAYACWVLSAAPLVMTVESMSHMVGGSFSVETVISAETFFGFSEQ
jgi:hypothetical protein